MAIYSSIIFPQQIRQKPLASKAVRAHVINSRKEISKIRTISKPITKQGHLKQYYRVYTTEVYTTEVYTTEVYTTEVYTTEVYTTEVYTTEFMLQKFH